MINQLGLYVVQSQYFTNLCKSIGIEIFSDLQLAGVLILKVHNIKNSCLYGRKFLLSIYIASEHMKLHTFRLLCSPRQAESEY